MLFLNTNFFETINRFFFLPPRFNSNFSLRIWTEQSVDAYMNMVLDWHEMWFINVFFKSNLNYRLCTKALGLTWELVTNFDERYLFGVYHFFESHCHIIVKNRPLCLNYSYSEESITYLIKRTVMDFYFTCRSKCSITGLNFFRSVDKRTSS